MADGRAARLETSQDFVFRDSADGRLEFVGDFDGFYRAVDDPWGQTGADWRMGDYYRYSRSNIVRLISSLALPPRLLEVGCGLGQVCRQIAESGAAASVAGLDISAVAVERARGLNPGVVFYTGDFAAPEIARLVGRLDMVIFNQLLWYVLDRLPRMLANAREVLNGGGHLLICNAFLREPQRFGREIVDGFDGLIRYLATHTEGRFRFVRAHLHRDPALVHDDGYVLMEAVAAP